MSVGSEVTSEIFPLLWSESVEQIVDWAVQALGLVESWRAPGEDGRLEHAELLWPGGRVSINIKAAAYEEMGPSGIALRVDDRAEVESRYQLAQAADAEIVQDLAESRIAYGFTALDPDGNQWWVHAENGFLDQLRQ